MPSEPVWVDADELIELNRLIVAASIPTPEPHVVLMENVLRGVANRPYEFWRWRDETDPAALGVRLLVGVARAQSFAQGNKRTGWYGAIRFFDLNSLYLDIDDGQEYADLIIAICNRKETEERLIDEFRERLIETI